jgi:hypothetical protein
VMHGYYSLGPANHIAFEVENSANGSVTWLFNKQNNHVSYFGFYWTSC